MTVKRKLQILALMWGGFLLAMVCGAWTADLFRVLFAITLVWIGIDFRKKGDLAFQIVNQARKSITLPWTAAILLGLTFLTFVAHLLDFESLNAPLWDQGIYIQAVRNLSVKGQALFPVIGSNYDYTKIHRTLSIHALGALYSLFQTPWTQILWQSFFHLSLAWIGILYVRELHPKQGDKKRLEPIVILAAFLCSLFIPTIANELLWSYDPHIAGIAILALAYLFYFKEQWLLWAFCMILFSYEKEDYGIVAFGFSSLLLVDLWIPQGLKSKSLKGKIAKSALALGVAGVGITSFLTFKKEYGSDFNSFGKVFGPIGQSPKEAIQNLWLHPELYFRSITRGESLSYLTFYFITSFVWIKPSWRSVKFMIPVLPLLGINSVSYYAYMQQVGYHYSLPLAVALTATRIFGVYGQSLEKVPLSTRGQAKAWAPLGLLILVSVTPLLWGQQNPFRAALRTFSAWKSTQAERAFLSTLRANPELQICCEDRLCTTLANREQILAAHHCTEGNAQFGSKDSKAIYVVYFDTELKNPTHQTKFPHVPFPSSESALWEFKSQKIKVSRPISLQH